MVIRCFRGLVQAATHSLIITRDLDENTPGQNVPETIHTWTSCVIHDHGYVITNVDS